MNGREDTNAGGEAPVKKMPEPHEFDLIACNLFAIIELAGDMCMENFRRVMAPDGTEEGEYRIRRREGDQLIAMLRYARDAAEAKLGEAIR